MITRGKEIRIIIIYIIIAAVRILFSKLDEEKTKSIAHTKSIIPTSPLQLLQTRLLK